MIFKTFPRLSGLFAEETYAILCDLSVEALADMARTSSNSAEFSPTGSRITEEELLNLRSELVNLARLHGYPEKPTRKQAASFDADCGKLLHESLPIFPGEAARAEVWSFLTLILLPDIARWRFPDANIRRFIGGVRNALQRLWWRGHALFDENDEDGPYHLLSKLDEDVLVGIMERPSISSNRLLARTIGRGAWHVSKMVKQSALEDVRRNALIRVRQRLPVVTLEALEEQELRRTVWQLFKEAATAYN